MICPNCNAENRPQSKFCQRCGHPLIIQPPYPIYEGVPSTQAVPGAAWDSPREAQEARGTDLLKVGTTLIAIISCVIFVLIFSIAFPAYSLSSNILDSDLYLNALTDQNLYEDFPALFGEQMDFFVNKIKSDFFIAEVFFKNVGRSDWEIVAKQVITPDWVKTQTESLVNQVFDYANNDSSELTMKVSLIDVKERLGGQIGFDTYMAIISTKPECDMLELAQWLLSPLIDILPICKIPENADFFVFSAPDPKEVVPQVLANWANTLPEEKDLASSLEETDIQELDDYLAAIRLTRTVAGIFIVVSILFLLLTLISPQVRSLKGWLRYWGVPLLVAGILCTLTAIALSVLMIWQINDLFDSLADIFVPGVIKIGKDIGQDITFSLATPLGILGVIMLLCGFGMAGASLFIGSKGSSSSYPSW